MYLLYWNNAKVCTNMSHTERCLPHRKCSLGIMPGLYFFACKYSCCLQVFLNDTVNDKTSTTCYIIFISEELAQI